MFAVFYVQPSLHSIQFDEVSLINHKVTLTLYSSAGDIRQQYIGCYRDGGNDYRVMGNRASVVRMCRTYACISANVSIFVIFRLKLISASRFVLHINETDLRISTEIKVRVLEPPTFHAWLMHTGS